MAGRQDEMRQRYEEFNQGDIQSATQNWAEDFVWDGGRDSDLPGAGEHKGKDQALQVLQQAVGAWDEYTLHADEFLEEGDTSVVLCHQDVKKGGQSATMPVVHIWRWQGDEIKRLQILLDSLQAAELQGIVRT